METKGHVGYHQTDQHMHYRSPRRKREREWGRENIWRNNAENFTNLMKDININKQEAQWTPRNPHRDTLQSNFQKPKSLESSKREVTCRIQGILNKIISRFLIRNSGGQKAVGQYIQSTKRNKTLSTRTPQKKWIQQNSRIQSQQIKSQGFPGGAVVGNPPANAGDTGSSPGLGRSHMPRTD